MLTDQEFASLIAEVRSGDAEAARKCVRLYESEIRRAARVRLTDPRLRRLVDSIDICQSVFGRFFVSAANGSFDLERPEQLLALLVRMTRNRVIDLNRRATALRRDGEQANATQAEVEPDDVVQPGDGPRTAAAARELLAEVRSRLRPDELQLADRRNAGESWTAIARELGGSPEALRKQLERALARVRSELGIE